MVDLANKMLVRHVSLGVGKVIALEANAVHVFFPDRDQRFAVKLRLPDARALLQLDGVERNSWLEGLSGFSLDSSNNRYALSTTWLTHDQAVEQFLALFPRGFDDPKYLVGSGNKDSRTAQWRTAHETWEKELGNGEGRRLLEAEEFDEIVRRLRLVERCVGPLHPKPERDTLKQALSGAEEPQIFLGALLDVLDGPLPGRAQFERLFAAVVNLPVQLPLLWPVATILPFVAQPDRHVFLRAKPTRDAAVRLGCDPRFEETPNWTTYSTLRKLSVQLLERLRQHGARDFIDVESFLHVIAATRSTLRHRSERS